MFLCFYFFLGTLHWHQHWHWHICLFFFCWLLSILAPHPLTSHHLLVGWRCCLTLLLECLGFACLGRIVVMIDIDTDITGGSLWLVMSSALNAFDGQNHLPFLPAKTILQCWCWYWHRHWHWHICLFFFCWLLSILAPHPLTSHHLLVGWRCCLTLLLECLGFACLGRIVVMIDIDTDITGGSLWLVMSSALNAFDGQNHLPFRSFLWGYQ